MRTITVGIVTARINLAETIVDYPVFLDNKWDKKRIGWRLTCTNPLTSESYTTPNHNLKTEAQAEEAARRINKCFKNADIGDGDIVALVLEYDENENEDNEGYYVDAKDYVIKSKGLIRAIGCVGMNKWFDMNWYYLRFGRFHCRSNGSPSTTVVDMPVTLEKIDLSDVSCVVDFLIIH